MSHAIFANPVWDISTLPEPYNRGVSKSSETAVTDMDLMPGCRINIAPNKLRRSTVATINANVVRVVLAHAGKLPGKKISLLNVSSGDSDVVWTLAELDNDGESLLVEHKYTLSSMVESLSGVSIGTISKRSSALKPISDSPDTLLLVYFVLVQTARRIFPAFDTEFSIAVNNAIALGKNVMPSDEERHQLMKLSFAFYRIIEAGAIKANVNGGNIDVLGNTALKNGIYNDADVLFGKPALISGSSNGIVGNRDPKTFKEAKAEFEKYHKRKWTDEEKMLIPEFPDSYPIAPEALKLARRYVQTKKSKNPMVNFLWRGITAYGKSTGVKLMAAMLNMPLVRITCNSTMETQDFLSQFVPDNGAALTGDAPTVEEMYLDPEGSYERLTGSYKDGVTADDCLKELMQRAARSSGTPRFKLVESNYVKALSRGWIVEIQEMSRVRDPGVLVGLNEYNEPGAIVPLADGGYVRRHPDALCVYTDNVGYVSCRPVDPSVIRRMAIAIDSYEMPKATVLSRVKYNTGLKDTKLLTVMYTTWNKLNSYCKSHDISDGSLSVTELENWAMCVKQDGGENLYQNCIDCVISKITNDIDAQKELESAVLSACIKGN